MNNKIKNELIKNCGLCIYNSVINNNNDKHDFILNKCNIKFEYIEISLKCKDCKHIYSLDVSNTNDDNIFLSILEYGLKQYFMNDNPKYTSLRAEINALLYGDCKYRYEELLKNNNK